jgi:lysozyme
MARTIPIQAVRLVQTEEGCVLHPYRDQAGRWTIFTGHLIKPTEHFPAPWTQAQADAVLAADMATAGFYVSLFVKVPLDDNQFGALVSFTFNEGPGALHESSLLTYINGGGTDAAQIAHYFGEWDEDIDPITHLKVVSKGLVNRRTAEAALYNLQPSIAA